MTGSNGVTRTLAVVAIVAGLAACSDDGDDGRFATADDQEQPVVVEEPDDANGEAGGDPEPTAAPDTDGAVGAAAASGIDDEEVAGLLWMREEEQLAHDVYTLLGDQWGLRIFENIAASEQTHIEATVDLLDRFDLTDPVVGNEPGTFTDPAIQALYGDLAARGSASRDDALVVGATIEELDIADLRARADATDEQAIVDVYARLERASRNHLRAFVGQLDLLGVEYEPTVLADFEEIVTAPMERGRDDR